MRQNKKELLKLIVPPARGANAVAREVFSNREKFYVQRLREADLLERIT